MTQMSLASRSLPPLLQTDVQAVPGFTTTEYIDWLQWHHPRLLSVLEQRVHADHNQLSSHFLALGDIAGHVEFNQNSTTGRGKPYRERQKRYPLARATGYQDIFRVLHTCTGGMKPCTLVADCLGGNGTLFRASRALLRPSEQPYWITADSSADMVLDAICQDLPVIRQAAQYTLFVDNVLDAAFFGYGFHYIDPNDRPRTLEEAYRYLKPGGAILLQDFEEGSPTARWYSEGLDLYTTTGHKYKHFTEQEYRQLLSNAGFENIQIFRSYDPFVFTGADAEMVRFELLDHLVEMFGMVKLSRQLSESERNFSDSSRVRSLGICNL